jgi:excinuclease ABC subunit C
MQSHSLRVTLAGVDREVPRAISRLPLAPGVYRFRDAAGEVLYIGRATALRSRVTSYWSDLRGRRHLAPMVARVARVEAVACDSPHEAAWLERNLLETARPRWNRTAGGQESPVYLRLDARPQAPGLTVARRHQPGGGLRYFGPYLGGLRARQAAAAIGRVCPLAATGTALGGAERDMARARGAAGGDRGALAAAVAAILAREPAAVSAARARLEQLRDAAAEVLAFELAGKIDSELRSLDWVTSPQRVTTLEPACFEACGWSGQVLVRFVIRAGRLCEWSQERYDRTAATAALAATPAGWAGFARRTAELAATLSA